ncbi:MAG: alpha/beta hydrolase [Hyphomicrobiaceae bacterium]
MNATTKIDETLNAQSASMARPQVIAVHGSASTGGQWRRLVADLGADFDVVTPDLPGYGRSADMAPQGRTTLAGDAIEVARLVNASTEPNHLVAHSYGAAVVLNYARKHWRRIASLTIIEPALFHLLRSGEASDLMHYTEISSIANTVRLSATFGTHSQGMESFVDYWNGKGAWAAMKPTLQSALASQVTQVARNFEAGMAETWSAADCGRIGCPTLIITAEASRGPAKRVAEIIAGSMPHAQFATIADAGHMAPVTHPDIINPLIAEALVAATSRRSEVSHREAA